MSKKLNEAAMASELGGSTFFRQAAKVSADPPIVRDTTNASAKLAGARVEKPRDPDTAIPRGSVTGDVLETIRKAVRQLGKEDATYRFTSQEKKGLADIVHAYGAADIRTSQNEITRIGINYLLEEYRANGGNSILARVLARLNA